MPYRGLGSRQVIATADQTGLNTGNWTNAFTADLLAARVPWFEVHHAVITSAPTGAVCTVNIGARPFSFTAPLSGAEWDPNQPALLHDGQDLFFLWNAAATGTPPVITIWLRHDPLMKGIPI